MVIMWPPDIFPQQHSENHLLKLKLQLFYASDNVFSSSCGLNSEALFVCESKWHMFSFSQGGLLIPLLRCHGVLGGSACSGPLLPSQFLRASPKVGQGVACRVGQVWGDLGSLPSMVLTQT